ncbi:S-adenosyl-L-methionine-dependent methyltransferase [Glomus cerebriforme]|uniref:S-adenosyl-L-methionine-dependent methyltransferase n=1 Tax=Glomus cerebriforme TaxID=658196 RepID=A0A397SBR8_9GLOM|nr:S-adenosyl-L-methionine-dependent methyltransferase [Glomus cerebriforme]
MGKSQSKDKRNNKGTRQRSQSTNECIREYISKRKYHESYVFPFDDDEVDRLIIQHYIFQYIWDCNFSSPVDNLLKGGAKVLDVGCGPGVWTLEMADKYRNSSFTGIDIVANFPQTIKPENTTFVTGNLKKLPFEDNTFDFVYMRLMMFALTMEEWPGAITELIRVCKPNGWIEIMERDLLWYNETETVRRWRSKIVDELREKNGIELIITPHIPGLLRKYDQLSNINSDEREAKIAWGGKIYVDYGKIIKWGARNLSNAVSEIRFSEGQYESLINIAIEELAKSKGYDKSHRFWAQKKA